MNKPIHNDSAKLVDSDYLKQQVIAYFESDGWHVFVDDAWDGEKSLVKGEDSELFITEATELYCRAERDMKRAIIAGRRVVLRDLVRSHDEDPYHELDIPSFVEFYGEQIEKELKTLEEE